ncbi:MAG: response regulator [Betaproteobacteria bacterium]
MHSEDRIELAGRHVGQHGGCVSVASAGESRGSTTIVTLTLAAGDDASRPQCAVAALPGAPVSIVGRRILVVDDDPDACDVMRMILEWQGARVDIAHSAAAALEKIKQDPPDVLVSDIGMPGQSGYQLIEAVRKLKGYAAKMLAVAVTAFSRPEDRMAALKAGFNMHLAKPLNAAELIAVIANIQPEG